jgi:hypothetical protein
MMLRLARPDVTPPGGFHYRDPDLDVEFEGHNVEHLTVQVNRARLINHLPPILDMASVIEDAICRGIPACLTVPAERAERTQGATPLASPYPHPAPGARVSESAALLATMKILRRAPRLISWDMAAPRASICRGCECNTQEPCCYGCKLASVFATHVGSVRYRSGSDMSYAGVCSADSTFTKATLRVNDPPVFAAFEYPAHCWKLRKEVL